MIKLEGVSVEFPAVRRQQHGLHRDRMAKTEVGGVIVDQRLNAAVRALEDVSFTVEPGDRLALLGHNGAGKTTLLRVIAKIYTPTRGTVYVNGQVAPLLNLSFGLDLETSGYDNIWVRAMLLGMSRGEIQKKIEKIVAFSELGEFIHFPLRTYSSGMKARLAFAISTHVDADVLLLDEVVATGDAAFVYKARQQLCDITDQSRIMVLASHSNKVLRELCNKGLLLERGQVKEYGPLDEVISSYKAKLKTESLIQVTVDRSVAVPSQQVESVEGPQPRASKENPTQAPGPKRILLVNDTGKLPNPGCRAVRKAYKTLFGGMISGSVVSASIPVNYWMESFRSIAIPGKEAIDRREGDFAVGAAAARDIDLARWEEIREGMRNADAGLNTLLCASDLVVVNGEGTIHHNSVRALALLALAKTAIEAGKKVVLLNATVQAMTASLIKDIFPKFAFIHARDARTRDYLQAFGLEAYLAPDLAFLALDTVLDPLIRLLDAKAYALVTGGVAVTRAAIESMFDAVQENGLRPVYLAIGDGGETDLASEVCQARNAPLVHGVDIGVKRMSGFLKQFPVAISGRHHINIFLMRAGVPFISLPSNTWKIEETLKMVGYPGTPIRTYTELTGSLRDLIASRAEYSCAGLRAYETGRTQMSRLVERLAACV